jgi:hypothetical protein
MNFRSFSCCCNLFLHKKEGKDTTIRAKESLSKQNNGKFTLELLFQIIGIGSASGLIYKDNSLLIIGDNSGFFMNTNGFP